MKILTSFLYIVLFALASCTPDSHPAPNLDPPQNPPPVQPPPVTPPGDTTHNPTDTVPDFYSTLSPGWMVDTVVKGGADIFFEGQTGYIAGPYIYKSTDAGKTWQLKYQSTGVYDNMAMSGDDALFVNQGRMLITHDGGESFTTASLDIRTDDVFFAEGKTAYAMGSYLWRSDDAGDHWTQVHDFTQDPISSGYKTLFFTDKNTGWVAGTYSVYKTSNGGIDWTPQNLPDFATDHSSITGIHFIDSLHGEIVGSSSIATTDDSGITWIKKYAFGQGSSAFRDIFFTDVLTGYTSYPLGILKTIDGGITWQLEVGLKMMPDNNSVFEVHFTDANHGWACGKGVLLRYVK